MLTIAGRTRTSSARAPANTRLFAALEMEQIPPNLILADSAAGYHVMWEAAAVGRERLFHEFLALQDRVRARNKRRRAEPRGKRRDKKIQRIRNNVVIHHLL